MDQVWKQSFAEAQTVLARFAQDEVQLKKCVNFSELLVGTLQRGGNVFTCGNGGSHCDAMHFAEELTGRYRKDRRPLGALALGDASHITCTSNDFGFEFIFERQLRGLGRKGDLLICFSTSGHSKNVVKAAEAARSMGLTTVGLLGKDGGLIKDLTDIAIIVPAQTADRIQEMHIKIVHMVIESAERILFPEHYRS